MKQITYPLVLMIMIGLILASCSIGQSDTADNNLPVIQATSSPADFVSVELTTQVDTAVQYNTVGQVMHFKYIVKMVRNDLTDATPPNLNFVGATPTCPAINTVGNLDERLDAGEIIECTFDLILTQADLDRGSVSNVVTAIIYTVNSNTVTTTVPTISAKAMTLTVTANPTSYSTAGQTITLTYVIKNTGSTQLGPAQFTITDPLINAAAPFNCGNADATIAPDATLSCSSTYTITSADAGAASVTTTATVTGGGANPVQSSPVTILKGAPSSNLTTGATVQHTVAAGEWLWQIARCYGADPKKTVEANPQLANPAEIKAGIVVTVPNIGSKGTIHYPQPCVGKHTVQSGDTWSSIAAKYGADTAILQMANKNTLEVGKEIKIPLYTAGVNPQPSTGTNALSLTISASPTTYSQVGQVITLMYVIKNSGTSTLGPAQFTITDPLVSASSFNCGPAATTLSPGASTTCSVNYTISQADMGVVSVTTKAMAAGGGAPQSPAADLTILKSINSLSLTSSPSPTNYNQVGQVITFNYVITNNGTTTLGPGQFTVTDILIGPNPINCGGADTTLTPNATVTCSANYTITEADMTFASISNSATASGGGVSTTQPDIKTVIKQ